MTFEPGDIVQLLSGGAYMTVRFVVEDLLVESNSGKRVGVHCDWHDNQGQPCSASYRPKQLMKK